MTKKIACALILLAVLVFNGLRFWKLDTVPSGFHINELASAVTVQCLAQSGCDARMTPWPLFGGMDYGQDKPPTFIYPGMLWAKAFGSTVPSLRAYSVCIFLIGVLGLFFLGRELFGAAFGLAVVLAASVSPWGWVVSRLALESWGAPVALVWGLYFFWRSSRPGDWVLAGFLLAAAMYAYPPARLQIPLMLVTLAAYETGRRKVHWPSVLGMAGAFILTLAPMAFKYLHGGLNQRFDSISIFNKDYLYVMGKTGAGDIVKIFTQNYALHLSPDFLFFKGDPSYMYSTRHSGIFSILDIAALLWLAVFFAPLLKHKRWLAFLAANFFIGIIPSALTNQGLPHALRTCGSWPFMMLFTGFVWWSAAENFKLLWPAMALLAMFAGGILTHQYFTVYAQESAEEFGTKARQIAEQIKTPEDWQRFLLVFHPQQYHCRYFLAHQLNLSCQQADEAWQVGHL